MKRFFSMLSLLMLASATFMIGCGPGEPEIPKEGEGVKKETGAMSASENSATMTLEEPDAPK